MVPRSSPGLGVTMTHVTGLRKTLPGYESSWSAYESSCGGCRIPAEEQLHRL